MEGSTKKTKGKQKREMKKIEKEKDLYITFTKRKDGLHKKATELKALVDADADILMFSPSGNPFPYGNPSIESMIMSRSMRQQKAQDAGIYNQLVEEHKRLGFQQLNEENDAFVDGVYAEKERKKQLDKVLVKKNYGTSWWEANQEDVGNYGLSKGVEESLSEAQMKLKNNISQHDDAAAYDQTNVGVGPYYPAYGSASTMPEVAFGGANLSVAGGFGSNTLTLAPSGGDQYQGHGGFPYNASNENAGGSGSRAYNASDENEGFPFPLFSGYGHGHY